MSTGYKRIKILSEAEIHDLYSLPKFTLEERVAFFSLNKKEKALIDKIPDIPSQVHAILQLGYFKAKGRLFSFNYEEVQADLNYVLTEYFSLELKNKSILLKAKKEANNKSILDLLNFKAFDETTREELIKQALLLARIHANHIDIFRELLSHMQIRQIVLPGYTVLQDIISLSINMELRRIESILLNSIPPEMQEFLSDMLYSESSNFSTLKIQPKNFKYAEFKNESSKALTYSKLYKVSLQLIDQLEISPKCVRYYANIAEGYNIYRLKETNKHLQKLYLICYIKQRYQQIVDNLVTTFIHHNNGFIQEASEYAQKELLDHTTHYNEILPKVSKLLRFMGEQDAEKVEHKSFWKTAYGILPKKEYVPTADYIAGKAFDFEAAKWEFYLKHAKRIKANLRVLFKALEFHNNNTKGELIDAISFLKQTFEKGLSLSKIDTELFPDQFIPKHIKKYLRNPDSQKFVYHPDKYEFYVYQSIVKEIDKGNIFCNDSTKYKSLSADLLSDKIWQNKEELIQKLGYPNIDVDILEKLEELEERLHDKILDVNKKIDSKENQYFKIKEKNLSDIKWYLTNPKAPENDEHFFDGLPNINISDLLYFVNQQTNFCRAFEHNKPRYAKQKADYEGIVACIVANGFSFGTYLMAQSCDISYSSLSNIEKNFFSIENLKEANDTIVNKIAGLKVFRSWNIFADKLLAGVDGQKFETKIDTIQSRYSSKYFGLKKGVVAFSMLLNHVPVNCKIIGANEHESHYVYDIIYNNTADIDPDVVSGDMHSVNRVNFAALDSISKSFMPNFTSPAEEAKNLKSIKPLNLYKGYMIRPTKLANKKLIIEEWDNIQRIFVSLATQESTQATIVRKLSSHKRYSRIKNALWEYDSILKSLYLLDFIDNGILRSQIRKALNRVEAYHQLRKAITKVHSGKFRGMSIVENEVWNQCSRFIANSVILYNAIILDTLLADLETQGDEKGIKYLQSISPARWQHINFIGKYEFRHVKKRININDIISQLHDNLRVTI
ncbi:Putative transposase [Candidatus Phycorickettsia trachydisci]|uniref:Transposase n=1 Tax=Candidatus Phycorickettsia trachydisci TaxID=2115978 RepID=A0A2P1P9T4_9RICK|nr:Tn3 family transposase [Candidatus Phycorickettsia trachydisci]AVP88044.1 Putative transposase [Candidatus Phycorickettsia trachydisci]